MNRLIPGKTKVQVELFRGVKIGDIIVSAIGLTMIVFVLISSLPYKLAFCVGIALGRRSCSSAWTRIPITAT